MPANRNVTSVETFTGRYVELVDPQPEQITLEDIAVGLSNVARFAGQTTRFYSVAEHAVRVSYEVPTLWALHHDSHEAYLGDMTAPLKSVLRAEAPSLIEELTFSLDWAIRKALGISAPRVPERDLIKAADDEVMYREASLLKHSHGIGNHWQNDVVRTPWAGMGWSPSRAERKFYERHLELANG